MQVMLIRSSLYVWDDSAALEPRYRARFYIDPNSILMGSSDIHTIFAGYPSSGSTNPVLRIQIRKVTGAQPYQVQVGIRRDNNTWVYSAWFGMTDAPHGIEIDWRAASAPGSNDGRLTLWIDGSQKADLTGIDNDQQRVDRVRLGAVDGLDPGTRGTYCFDAFVSRRQSYIGPESFVMSCYGGGSSESASDPALNVVEKSPEFSTGLKGTLELLAGEGISQTITYDYDPLNRLTAADYYGGRFYHYSYDAAGNRTHQVSSACADCPEFNVNYAYDIAQRLSNVNGVAYTWDDNGNLLSDGINTFAYDNANRLISITNPQYSIQNGYNGLGDRLRQTVNSSQTNYILDLNNNLAQVLSDDSNTYLYGLGRIAQQNTVDWQYYQGDALGSVRQLSDPAGVVTLARSYEPFGKVLNSEDKEITSYAFTGEWSDPTGLIYLRARYYDPATGRFLSRDPFPGTIISPRSQQPYVYAINNPVLYVDPSGKVVWIPALLGIGGLVGGASSLLSYLLTPNTCLSWQEALLSFGTGFAAGVVGTGTFLLVSTLLPASIPAAITGAIAGWFSGTAGAATANILTGNPRPWEGIWVSGFIGAFSGGIAGRWYSHTTRVGNPNWQPRLSVSSGWGYPFNNPRVHIGPRSIALAKSEIIMDLVGGTAGLLSTFLR